MEVGLFCFVNPASHLLTFPSTVSTSSTSRTPWKYLLSVPFDLILPPI